MSKCSMFSVLAVVGSCALSSSCVDVSQTPAAVTSPTASLSSKERVWIAFLECHTNRYTGVMFRGHFPGITLTQTEQDKTSSANVSVNDLVKYTEAEGIVMSSGDPELIKLHERMKAGEKRITARATDEQQGREMESRKAQLALQRMNNPAAQRADNYSSKSEGALKKLKET